MLRVQSGDEAALAQLLERHARLVLGIGYRILRDAGEAQELVQDVFLVAYRKCRLFDPQRGSFRAWLGRIAYRRALDRREYLNLHRFTMAAIWMTLPMCFRPPQMWSIRLS